MAIALPSRLTAAIRARAAAWRPGLIAAGIYLALCIVKSGPVGLVAGHTWQNWWDQGEYLRSAHALVAGDLSPEKHWYPLLYSLFAAPFVPLMPHNPFVPLDVICFGVVGQSVVRVGRHLGIGERAALIALFATVAWPGELWNAWVYPWTTTLSAALLWWLMAEAGDAGEDGPPIAPGRIESIGAVAAMVPLARPSDAPVAAVLGLYLAVSLWRRGDLGARAIGAGFVGAAVPLAIYGLLHLAIYGADTTAYMKLSGEIGLAPGEIGWKAVVLFLDPAPWFPDGRALLARMPWVVLGLAGAVFALARRDQPGRTYLAALLAAAAVNVVTMTVYVDFLPSALWRFNSIHYLKWILPLLGMTAWLLLRDARMRPGLAAGAVAGTIALTCFRFDAVPAAATERARRIDFAAPAGFDWPQVYFAQSVMAEPRRIGRNIFDFRQLPDGAAGVRAVALRGDFSPEVTWYPGGSPFVQWPPGNAGTPPLMGVPPAKPVARWRAHLAWGRPCWLLPCR